MDDPSKEWRFQLCQLASVEEDPEKLLVLLGTRAVLWSDGSVVDLNDLVPDLPVGTILTGAFSINDDGQIVAFGVSNPSLNKNRQARTDDHLHSGATHVYLLTP
jgi:hypothetical protein